MQVRAPQRGRERERARHDALTLSWELEVRVNALSYYGAGLVRKTGKGCSERAMDDEWRRGLSIIAAAVLQHNGKLLPPAHQFGRFEYLFCFTGVQH